MDDHTLESASAAAKLISGPAFIGICAGAVGFLFMWPTTRREGFSRIIASGVCSHFFGAPLLATTLHFFPWLDPNDVRAACYLIVGLPGWWVLGYGFRWLANRQGKDAAQVALDLAQDIKHIKETL